MLKKTLSLVTLASTLSLSSFAATAAKAPVKAEDKGAENIEEAFTKGKLDLEFRLGYEMSDLEDNGAKKAHGLNLRSRIGFRTAELAGISAYAQVHNNWNLDKSFNDNTGDNTQRDVIADPEETRLHQAYVDLNLIPDTLIRIGRQEIILDNARFVGNIGWRQNGQSFDAVTVVNNSFEDLTLTGSFVKDIQTILGTEAHLEHLAVLHARYKASEKQNYSLFTYLLDTEDSSRDSVTIGARADGQLENVVYDFTVASQSDYSSGSGHDSRMLNSYVGLKEEKFSVGLGYDYFSGADNAGDKGFDTLVGTAHKFNGWSDQFLGTNGGKVTDGLQDLYVQASTKIEKTKLLARIHNYEATERSAGTYGQEYEVVAKRPFKINDEHKVTVLAKAALFKADEAGSGKDETVFWLRAIYKY